MTLVFELSDAFPGLILNFAVRCFALGFVCACALRLLRVRDAAWQYATWRFALFAMLILPMASMMMPAVSIPAHLVPQFISRAEKLPQTERRYIDLNSAKQFTNIRNQTGSSDTQPPRHSTSGASWALIGLASYLLVTGTMLFRIALGWLLMHHTALRMQRLENPRLLERANRQCTRLALLSFPEFRAGPTVGVPMTFGWKNPVILLPEDWDQWPIDKLDLVLAHELSHIQRGDYFIRILSALNKSLYWFHPVSWWLDKRLAELSEHVSDDAALAVASSRRERYAEILSDFASKLDHSPRRFSLGIAMSVSKLGNRRMKRVLDQHRTLSSKLKLGRKLAVFAFGIPLLVLIAGAQTADHARLPITAQIGPEKPAPRISVVDPQVRRLTRIPHTPMFSSAYLDALQGVTELEPRDAAMLEERLTTDPDDFSARLKLIAYCMRPDRVDLPESRKERIKLVLWLVEHHPDSEILGSPYAVPSASDLAGDQLQRAQAVWETATKGSPADARLIWNAANFYSQCNRGLYIASLQRAVALAPDNENYAQALGLLYGGAILTVNSESMYRDPGGADPELARHATEELDTTPNAHLIEPAVRLLQSDYNRSLMMGKPNPGLGELAARYFQRAKALDPGLDELWIYPKLDPTMAGMFAPGARPPDDGFAQSEVAAKNIRRLPVDTFQNLPRAIRATLRLRGCLVPQPAFDAGHPDSRLRNVVEGEFFEKGKTSWAVLCSKDESSSIFVFRHASDSQPEEIAKWTDEMYLQGAGDGKIVYSRQIQTADRKYIVDSARGNGEPEPPPIDHQGINDIFLGKASTVYYWYRGEWLKLSGDD